MIQEEKEFIDFCTIIKSHSGICVTGAHSEFLCAYIQKRINELEISTEQFLKLVQKDQKELTRLINQSTINETYFFREEKQFNFLKTEVFPSYKNREVTIWSAACSTGEEILSLAMLCDDCNTKARFYATDIDTSALDILRKAEYNLVSRRTDGAQFHSLLEKNSVVEQGLIKVNPDIVQKMKIGTFNLNTFSGTAEIPPDGTVDIIFLRNVFIYFDDDTRKKIIAFMERKLSPKGFLFFSMSEIASINPENSSSLSKQKHERVYFLQKEVNNVLPEKKSINVNKDQRVHSKISKNDAVVKLKSTKRESKIQNEPLKKVNNSVTKKELEQDFFAKLNLYLNSNKFDEAERFLDSYSLQIDVQYLGSYFKGLIEKMKGNEESALHHFERAAQINPLFWTAHIQCALLLQNIDPLRARKKYIRCAELLEKYLEEKSTKYDFLLESFSAEYFYTICTKNIEKGIQKCQ